MVDRSEFVVTFVAKDNGLVSKLNSVGKSGETAGKQVEQGFKRARDSSNLLADATTKLRTRLLGVGSAIAAAFTFRQGFQDAVGFGRAIGEVGTIAGVSASELRGLREETLNLATALGRNEQIVARGLYQTLSAGITDSADAFDVLGASADLAVAGVAQTSETVDLLTSVLNAYKLEASDATRISDLFFQTVRLGKTTVSELAASIGTVAPIAASAGVTIEELSAAIATITLSGLSTSEAATQVRATIVNLAKSAKDIRELFRGVGKEFNLTDIRTRGLVPVLEDLRQAVDGDNEALFNLLGRVEAANGVLNLTGPNLAKFNAILRDSADAAGSVEKALEIQFDQPALRFEAQLNAIREGVAEVVNAFVEGFSGDAAASAREFGEQLIELRKSVEDFGEVAGAVGSIASGLDDIFGGIADAISVPITFATGVIGGFDDEEIEFAVRQADNKLRERLGFLEQRLESDFDPIRALNNALDATSFSGIIDAFFNDVENASREAARDAGRATAAEFNEGLREFGALVDRNPFTVAAEQQAAEAAQIQAQAEQQRLEQAGEYVRTVIERVRNAAEEIQSIGEAAVARVQTFEQERLALLGQVTSSLELQVEGIRLSADAERERIETLVTTNELNRAQADDLLRLIDLIAMDAEAKLRDAEATRQLRDASQTLRARLVEFESTVVASGVSTRDLAAALEALQASARAGDVEEFNARLAETRELLEQSSGLGARFGQGFSRGVQTAGDIAEQLGGQLGSAFDTLFADLARGEDAWESFRDTAIRALAQVASRAIATAIVSNVFGGGGTLDTTSEAKGGAISFAGGGFMGPGGKRIGTGSFPIGGVVRDPTLALFGDQSNKFKGEAFVPIPSDAKGIPVDFRGSFPQPPAAQESPIINLNVTATDAKSFNDRIAQGETRNLIVGMISQAMGRDNAMRESIRKVSRN